MADFHSFVGFASLANARVLIEAWRRDYNEHRPKKDLAGIPLAVYAARLDTTTTSTTVQR
ncbi:MAG: transposase [Aromatoleum sp.]|nr:transposase [Aromatoleum sp.]